MKNFRLIIYLIFIFFLFSCSEEGKNMLFNLSPRTVINFQPFEDFQEEETKVVFDSLSNYFDNTIYSKKISLPQNAFIKSRNRYRADTLLRFLRDSRKPDTITVGLTHFDISTTKNGINDWGVMGLGYRPGRACVVSTFRLKKKNENEQLIKVILHEIGHTLNLPHCAKASCLMRDAEGGNPLDEEKDFCRKCKNHLRKKGLKVK